MDSWGFFVAVILVTLLGVLTGFATGLLPGLHVNSVAAFVIATQGAWAAFFGAVVPWDAEPPDIGALLACFIMATAAAHATAEFIPSVFLGAPSEETALATLPGHRMLRAGHGALAVTLAVRGAILGAALSAGFLVPMRVILGDPLDVAEHFRDWSAAFLAFVLVALVLADARGRSVRRILRAAGVQGLAGVLGLATLRGPLGIDPNVLLFPLFSGLFALPNLWTSLRSRRDSVPFQRIDPLPPLSLEGVRTALRGTLAGASVSWLPGLSGGAAATLASIRARRSVGAAAFMGVLGAVSTSTTILSVAVLFMIERARSGAAVAVATLLPDAGLWRAPIQAPTELLLLLLVSVAATALAGPLVTSAARIVARRCSESDPRRVSLLSLALLLGLLGLVSGPIGLAVAGLSAVVGMVPRAARVRRVHLMASLLVPALASHLGSG